MDENRTKEPRDWLSGRSFYLKLPIERLLFPTLFPLNYRKVQVELTFFIKISKLKPPFLDPAAGYKHGLYVLIGLVLALLALLLICIFLLKKRYTDKQNELHMGF